MLTTREFASLLLLAVALVILLVIPSTRRAVRTGVGDVLAAGLTWKLLVPVIALAAWIAVAVLFASGLGWWTPALIKDTIIVGVSFAVPMLFRSVTAGSGGAILRSVASETVGIAVLIVAYVNLESFPLAIEVIFQVVVSILLLTSASLRAAAARKGIRRGIDLVVSLLGLTALIYTTVRLFAERETYDWSGAGSAFLLTLWLPLALLPFLYVMGLVAETETAIMRASRAGRLALPLRVRLALVLGLRGSVKLAGRVNPVTLPLEGVISLRGGFAAMRQFRARVREVDRERASRLDLLERNAGVQGTSEDGAQLDRREFWVTKDVLRWIATTQMGRYGNNGNRYWDDLTDLMVDAEKRGLNREHGFRTEVQDDGQSWRSWRVLPSGWVLGIGGTRRRDDYYYSAPVPPETYPGDGPDWVDGLVSEPQVDWRTSDVRP